MLEFVFNFLETAFPSLADFLKLITGEIDSLSGSVLGSLGTFIPVVLLPMVFIYVSIVTAMRILDVFT